MAKTLRVSNEDARELAWLSINQGFDGYTVVENRQVDSNRWSSIHELVIRVDDVLYMTGYSQGLTESQDERPFEDDAELINFWEVRQVPVTTFNYEKIK